MSREEILNKLQDIFFDVFGDETIKINEQTSAEDIEAWDSLTNISILASVQDVFSVSFNMDEIVTMNNVKQIVDAIMGKIK